MVGMQCALYMQHTARCLCSRIGWREAGAVYPVCTVYAERGLQWRGGVSCTVGSVVVMSSAGAGKLGCWGGPLTIREVLTFLALAGLEEAGGLRGTQGAGDRPAGCIIRAGLNPSPGTLCVEDFRPNLSVPWFPPVLNGGGPSVCLEGYCEH